VRLRASCVGLVVFVAAGLGLTLTHHPVRQPVSRAAAIAAVLRDKTSREALAGVRWTRVSTGAVDGQLERVAFFAGDRVELEAAVDRAGLVEHELDYRTAQVPYGDWLAYEPAVLVGLGALFVLMTAVTPWRRVRNLDVAAVLSLAAPPVLLHERYLDASVLSAVPALLYLILRCGWFGVRGPRAGGPSRPLLLALTPGLDSRRRAGYLKLLLAVLVLVVVMVGVSSPDPVDVAYAAMEGATNLVHGMLPYGHMPGDVVHGDTYPIFTYLLYLPLASVSPVRSMWDSVDVALGLAAAVTAVTALALRASVPGEAGLRAAVAWLCFPALLITVSTGTTDVVLAALLAAAVILWRRPRVASGVLVAAAWFKLAPAALIPLWLAPLRGRRLLGAVLVIAAVSLAMVLVVVGVGGAGGVAAMFHAVEYQFNRGSLQSLWAAAGISGLQPVGEAAVLGLIAAGAARLRLDPDLATDRARVAALSAAILIALQLAASYWALLYVVWFAPLLCLSLLRSDEPALEPALGRVTAEARLSAQPVPAG
jgi:Glycosyltransferase family 87